LPAGAGSFFMAGTVLCIIGCLETSFNTNSICNPTVITKNVSKRGQLSPAGQSCSCENSWITLSPPCLQMTRDGAQVWSMGLGKRKWACHLSLQSCELLPDTP
jgi:hypothetical protein